MIACFLRFLVSFPPPQLCLGLFFHCLFHPCPVKSDFTLGTFSLVEVLFWKSVFFFLMVQPLFKFFFEALLFLYLASLWGIRDPGSQIRDWTHAPALGTQSPNHWTTREVPERESWKSVLRPTEGRLSRPFHIHLGLLALTYYPSKWYYHAVKTVWCQVLLSS